MQHEPVKEQAIAIQPQTIEDFKKNPKIRCTRRTLLVVLSIELV
jgi:hypothetical protein